MKTEHVMLGHGAMPMVDPESLTSVLSAASDLVLLVSANGIVLNVVTNQHAAYFERLKRWIGQPMTSFLTEESVEKFRGILGQLPGRPGPLSRIELNHADDDDWNHPVRYSVHPIGTDGSFLMLGTDLQPVAETQQRLVQAQIALEKSYEERREFDMRYRSLLERATDPFIFVSTSDGRIRDLNPPAATLFGQSREDLLGRSFAREFVDRTRGELIDELMGIALGDATSEAALQLRRTNQSVSVVPTLFRGINDRLLLCRFDRPGDWRPVEERLLQNLSALYLDGPDAFVFAGPKGLVESANTAFLELVEATASSQVVGHSIADFFVRGQVDLNVLLDNVVRAGQVRLYATKIVSIHGAQVPVEIAASYIDSRDKPSVALLVRDIRHAEALRTPTHSAREDADHQNVIDLVGSATLKEIVSETNDVIERMCIEAALEMTHDNRVAAAEMLGLSRQSLYVKLRKYGLMEKNAED